MHRRRFLPRLLLLLAAVAATVAGPAAAQPADGGGGTAAAVELRAVLVVASRQPGARDPRLEPYEGTLRRLLRFESYRFAGEAVARAGVPGSARLAPGRGQVLEVEAAGAAGSDQVRLQVAWREGEERRLATRVVVKRGVPAVLGGPPLGDGGDVYAVILVAR